MTGLYNVSGFGDMVILANTYTNNMFTTLFVLTLFFVSFFILNRYGFKPAILTSSLGCFIISLIMYYGSFINILFPLGFLAIAAFTLLWMIFSPND